jgi:hypothetical protein
MHPAGRATEGSVPTTLFKPDVHGFRFSNNEIKARLLFKDFPLCGGMAYAAIDYFASGWPIPPDHAAPVNGTSLFDYLFDRQVGAHVNTGAKFAGMALPIPVLAPALTGFSMNPDEELAKLSGRLASGVPVPICLANPLFGGHHLVAISCNATPPILITAYDPNHPGKLAVVQEITSAGSPFNKKFKNILSSKQWDHFFCDAGYSSKQPSAMPGQENWRHCSRCMGLYYAGHISKGACPAGGPHISTISGNYWLHHHAGPGQGNWRWCQACEGLFFASGSRGVCVQNSNGHDGSQSGDYFLLQSGGDQGQWFHCHVCSGLFFAGSHFLGKCPKNSGGHDGSKSSGYTLMVTSG